MKFNVIACDPPWIFGDKLDKMKATRKRGAQAHYNEMTEAEICAINVPSVCADDCVMALWCPGTHFASGLRVLQTWGFTYKQNAVWVKILPNGASRLVKGEIKSLRELTKIGMGRMFRQCHETILMGVRGTSSKMIKDRSVRSVIFAENPAHSQKPEALQDCLEAMFPDGGKLEMFARRVRPNWTCVGNEIDGKDINQAIAELAGESYTPKGDGKQLQLNFAKNEQYTFAVNGENTYDLDGPRRSATKILKLAPREDGIVMP